MSLPITSVVAACLAILMFPLTLQISMLRKSLGNVVFGDGDNAVLRRRTRAFGNFVEYAPMCLLMLALAEVAAAPTTLLWTVGSLLVAGRVLHAGGMLYADSPMPRGFAMVMTYLAFLVPAVWLLFDAWG